MDNEQMETLTAELTEAKAEIARLRQNAEKLQGQILAEGYTITSEGLEHKDKPQEEMIEVQGVMVPKASLPEVVVTALENAAKEKAELALEAKAKESLPNFKLDVAKALVGAFADSEEVMQALKAADKVFATKMEEVGEAGSQGDMVSAEEKLDALVKAYKAEHNVTYEKAYSEVAMTAEGKALIKETYKKD